MTKQQNQSGKADEEEADKQAFWIYWGFWFFASLAGLIFFAFYIFAPVVDCILNRCSFRTFYAPSDDFPEILLFSLGLIGASATLAISLWRGKQIDEQIDEAQKQFNQARFQNALQMATERENAGRCISGLRVLEDMYEDLIFEEDKETVHSVALYVLSLPKPNETGEIKRISRSARQRAVDILVSKGFLSQDKLEKSEREWGRGQELPVRDSMVEKDLSRLYLARRNEEENSEGRRILNLSNFSFRGCDFHGANLENVNFSYTNFKNTKLYGADLSRSIFINIMHFPFHHLEFTFYIAQQPEIKIDYEGADVDYKGVEKGPHYIPSWNEWREKIKGVRMKVSLYESQPKGIGATSSRPMEVVHRNEMGQDVWDHLMKLAEENAPLY